MNEFFQDKTVVVTGAAGFIASHLVDELLKLGAKVIGFDNFITGRKKNLSHLIDKPEWQAKFSFIEADVNNPVSSYLGEEQLGSQTIDLVFHLASPASPVRYQAHPVETYLVNSNTTHNLLFFLKQHFPQTRFVFASTSEVYGDPTEHPQTEKYWGNVNPNGLRSCYDESKRLGETICGVFQRDFHLDVRIMRIFNTYGPRMDPEDGRIIPSFIKQAVLGQPLTVFGDGSQTRSYCYVSDLVEGILNLASLPDLAGLTVNLGNPQELTVLETARLVQKLVPGAGQIKYSDLPADDPTRRQPDIALAKAKLGWQPTIAFAAGLAKTIEYFKRHELAI